VVCWCVGVLVCWCVGVLVYWCVGVLVCVCLARQRRRTTPPPPPIRPQGIEPQTTHQGSLLLLPLIGQIKTHTKDQKPRHHSCLPATDTKPRARALLLSDSHEVTRRALSPVGLHGTTTTMHIAFHGDEASITQLADDLRHRWTTKTKLLSDHTDLQTS